MTKAQIETFINSNSESSIQDFFDKLMYKLESIKSENIKTQLWLLVLIIIYYGIDLELFSEINLGTFSLKTDQQVIKLIVPLMFNYFLLQLAAINTQRGLIIKNIRQIGAYLYKFKNDVFEESMYSHSFLLVIMPFSVAEEVQSKYLDKGKTGFLTGLLTLPLIAIIFLPLIFPVLAIIDMISDLWSLNIFNKLICFLTIWLFIVTVYYYIKLIIKSTTDVRKDFSK